MKTYLRLVIFIVCLELVSFLFVLPVLLEYRRDYVSLAPSLSHALGKEYVLVQSERNEQAFEAWNYTYCENAMLRKSPYVIKLTEDSGEFVLAAKLEVFNLRFQLDKEFEYGNGKKCTISLNDTTLIQHHQVAVTTMDFAADELQLIENTNQSNDPIILKWRQVKDNSILQTSTLAPSLAHALGKEYVLERSEHNRKSLRAWGLRKCEIDALIHFSMVIKLTEDKEEFVLTSVFEVYNTRFQLGKQTVDSRGLRSTFTINGTTLTRVTDVGRDVAPRASLWRFGAEELQLQEDAKAPNTSVIFKPRK